MSSDRSSLRAYLVGQYGSAARMVYAEARDVEKEIGEKAGGTFIAVAHHYDGLNRTWSYANGELRGDGVDYGTSRWGVAVLEDSAALLSILGQKAN
jgi:hypothetical protein